MWLSKYTAAATYNSNGNKTSTVFLKIETNQNKILLQ